MKFVYVAAFLARISAWRERARESAGRVPVYGLNTCELLAKLDHDMFLPKIHQCLLLEELKPCYQGWPVSGTMQSGAIYQRRKLGQDINVTGFGFWQKGENEFATPTTMDKLPPKSAEALNKEATIARPGRTKPANLRDQISNMQNWPTPLASDNRNKGNCLDPSIKRRMELGKQVNLSMLFEGKLNPEWVEVLMGWPLGWTDLNQLIEIKNDLTEWNEDWENGIPRITKNNEKHKERLTAIGNGQVPLCAAVAFLMLKKRIDNE